MLFPQPELHPVAPVTFVCATVHVKFVPVTPELKAILGAVPLVINAKGGVAVATGTGLTVTSTTIGVPDTLLLVGVTVYPTIPPTTLIKTCAIVLPLPFEAPVTSVATTVHAKVVPGIFELRAIFVVLPLHIV